MHKVSGSITALAASASLLGLGMLAAPAGAATYAGTPGVIAYARFIKSGDQILTVDPVSGKIVNLSKTHYGDSEPSYSPDGTKLLFDNDGAIYTMTASGASRTDLTPNPQGSYGDPRWSPNGSRIVFDNNGDIGIMNANGSNRHYITTSGNDDQPDWSPNGALIAFRSYADEDQSRVFSMHSDGTHVVDLSSVTDPGFAYEDSEPDWAPDSQHLLMISSRSTDGVQTFEMSRDGTKVRQVTDVMSGADSPAFSPDAASLTYTGNNGQGHTEVFTEPLGDTSKARPVTTTPDNSIVGGNTWQALPKQAARPVSGSF